MIDKLISDPMKKIWINLFHILKDLNFLFFRDFFEIFWI